MNRRRDFSSSVTVDQMIRTSAYWMSLHRKTSRTELWLTTGRTSGARTFQLSRGEGYVERATLNVQL
jgi:hypothetical protein